MIIDTDQLRSQVTARFEAAELNYAQARSEYARSSGIWEELYPVEEVSKERAPGVERERVRRHTPWQAS